MPVTRRSLDDGFGTVCATRLEVFARLGDRIDARAADDRGLDVDKHRLEIPETMCLCPLTSAVAVRYGSTRTLHHCCERARAWAPELVGRFFSAPAPVLCNTSPRELQVLVFD
jgi:hypothetical protein